MGEKVGKITKFGLILTPSAIFWGKASKILKPVLDTSFRGLLLGKVWTMPTDLGSQHLGLSGP